jgi:hypothetical protein
MEVIIVIQRSWVAKVQKALVRIHHYKGRWPIVMGQLLSQGSDMLIVFTVLYMDIRRSRLWLGADVDDASMGTKQIYNMLEVTEGHVSRCVGHIILATD